MSSDIVLTSSMKRFFTPTWRAVLGSIATAILLVVAYSVSWLNWLVWIALVPYILASQGRKRRQVYLLTALWSLIYLGFVIAVNSTGMIVVPLGQGTWFAWTTLLAWALFFLAVFVLLSEIHLVGGRFIYRGWQASTLVWGVVILTVGGLYVLELPLIDNLATIFGIIPVSQPLFQLLAGTYGGYLLYVLVLIANYEVAKALQLVQGRHAWVVVGLAMAFTAGIGLVGGPLDDLPFSTPESQGMEVDLLSAMDTNIPLAYPHIRNVVVVRHGMIVFERYYRGTTPFTLNTLNSATKSFTGALVGIALREGDLHNPEQKMADFFPEYVALLDPRLKDITLRHLLTMTSGFQWSEMGLETDINEWRSSTNWIKYTFGLPIRSEPGQLYNYNSAGVHILSGIVNKVSQMHYSQFADRYLFGPLGISRRLWLFDPQGNNDGSGGLYLRTRDMAKFGYLYLQKGKWNGRQILSPDWVQETTRAHSTGGWPEMNKYGELFWLTTVDRYAAYYAMGYGGQYIYMVPDLDLVVAITSDTDRHYGGNKSILWQYIVPAVVR